MPDARDLLAGAAQRLAAAEVPSPMVDAELLLAHVTGRPRAMLRMAGSDPTEAQADRFAALVARRAERVPLQHLTGRAPFRHLELGVGPGTFIPRPETELLVDEVLGFLNPDRPPVHTDPAGPPHGTPDVVGDSPAAPDHTRDDGPVVVDLCTGSGALALSLATELRDAQVHAVELSAGAHAQAARNVAQCAAAISRAGSSLTLHHADATGVAEGCLRHLVGIVDVVVTNPPYVPDDAVPREPEVRDHDPHVALYGGPDGLTVVRALVGQAALLLRPGGLLLVEHADVQGEAAGATGVPHLLRAQREGASGPGHADGPGAPAWQEVHDHDDLTGRPRFTAARRRGGRMAP